LGNFARIRERIQVILCRQAELFFMGPARKLTPSSSASSIDDATTAANESLRLVVNEWDYICANWVYAVLSRVRTRLFLTKPLDLDREFNAPQTQSLIDFENRIRTNLEQPTLDKLAQKGHLALPCLLLSSTNISLCRCDATTIMSLS
jgi:hypothetical protein